MNTQSPVNLAKRHFSFYLDPINQFNDINHFGFNCIGIQVPGPVLARPSVTQEFSELAASSDMSA